MTLDWRDTRLKNLFTSVRNGVWGDDPDDETDVFCARGTDFDRTTNRISATKMPRRKVLPPVLHDHQLQHGDLVLEKSGGSADQPVGSVALFDLAIRTVCSNFNARLQVDVANDPRFVCYLMNSFYWGGFTRQFVKQTTGIQNLDAEAFLAQHCTIPPLCEQRRIADFLDAETARIDALATLKEQQVKLLDARYRTAISELTTPGISTVAERNAQWPWLPANTRIARLGYSARVQTGVTVDGKRERTVDDAEYPYLRVANVQGEEIDLSEVKTISVPQAMAARSMLRAGDLVMTEANGNPDNLGRGAVWRGQIPGMVHQNHIFAIRVDPTKLIPEYVSSLLASEHGRRYFRTTSTQVGIATTSSSKVLELPIPIRAVDEQVSIVKQCEDIRRATKRTTDVLGRQLFLLNDRRQALITAAVTGAITV